MLRRADRVMMIRMALHGVATVISALLAFDMARTAPMWQQMVLYTLSWVACALAYVPIAFAWESVLVAHDDRVRRIIREEFDRYELVNYQRELDRTIRTEIESDVHRRTHTSD